MGPGTPARCHAQRRYAEIRCPDLQMRRDTATFYSAVLLAACSFLRTPDISSLFFLPRKCVPSLRLHICIEAKHRTSSKKPSSCDSSIHDVFDTGRHATEPHLQSTLVLAHLEQLHDTPLIWRPPSHFTHNCPDLQHQIFVRRWTLMVPTTVCVAMYTPTHCSGLGCACATIATPCNQISKIKVPSNIYVYRDDVWCLEERAGCMFAHTAARVAGQQE